MRLRLGRVVVLSSVLAAAFAAAAFAGRPLETATTSTAAKGTLELELGGTYESGNVVSKSFFTEAALCYGLLENLELGVSTGGVVHGNIGDDNITGMGDSSLLAKWRFLGDEQTSLGAALEVSVNLPTGDVSKGLGSDEYDVSAVAAVSLAMPRDCTLQLNGGCNILQTEDDTATVAAAVQKPVGDKLEFVAEVVLDQSMYGRKEDKSGRGLIGMTCAVSDRLTLDFAVGAGFDNRTPDIIAVFGGTFIF